MPIIVVATFVFFVAGLLSIFFPNSKYFNSIAMAGFCFCLILNLLFFLTAVATCHLTVPVPACQTIYEQRQAQSLLTQASQTEEALLFTPTPTAAPYATAVRATAQAMRESALATLYPEGTPTP